MATETTSLAAHSYSVLAPAANNPVRTNKAIKSSKPMFHPPLSLARDLTLKRGDLTTVSPLQNSGLSPDHISNWDLSLAHALTFNRYDITAVPRLHISRRTAVEQPSKPCRFPPWGQRRFIAAYQREPAAIERP